MFVFSLMVHLSETALYHRARTDYRTQLRRYYVDGYAFASATGRILLSACVMHIWNDGPRTSWINRWKFHNGETLDDAGLYL